MFAHQKRIRATILTVVILFFWFLYVTFWHQEPLTLTETDVISINTNKERPRITTVLIHVEGLTVFENLYLRNGTLFVVHPDSASLNSTAQANGYPIRKNIVSKTIKFDPGVDVDPGDQELVFIRASDANLVLGSFPQRIGGVTVMMYDHVQFMHHYYHWWGEIILGAWRVYTTIDQSNVSSHRTFPETWPETEPMHFLIPFSTDGSWRDAAGVNSPLMRAAFPDAALEESYWWTDRRKLGTTVVFDRVMVVCRRAAHRHPNAALWSKMIAGTMNLNVTKGFWEPVRQAVLKGFLGHVPGVNEHGAAVDPESQDKGSVLPLVTYVSRQAGGRRLSEVDHKGLVAALEGLEREGVIRFRLARMEKMILREQIELAARTTVMVGVHGNGLTHQLWMPSSPWSTVIEIFRPKAYIFDYEMLCRNAGHRHYAVWNDTFQTYPEGTYHERLSYGVEFHGNDIPVFGPAVAAKIKERLGERH